MTESAETHKHIWRDNAIMIYSSELHHWEDIRTYHQSRVDEADAKIKERFQLIADLEGKGKQLPLPEPQYIEISPKAFSVKGIVRNFRKWGDGQRE